MTFLGGFADVVAGVEESSNSIMVEAPLVLLPPWLLVTATEKVCYSPLHPNLQVSAGKA